jgi:Tfp pilus assembly protein PilX
VTTLSDKQRGATLVITLITVALLAILAVYGVGMSVMDQRSTANEFRAKEASLAAESGIEQAIAHVNVNRKQIKSWTWTDWATPDGSTLQHHSAADRRVEVPAV